LHYGQQTVRANHALLLLVLVLAGVWVSLYTNSFPLVGNLLGLSGVLAVIPAFVGLLPEAQRKGYLVQINKALFESRSATTLYMAALVGIFTLFLSAKPLEIQYQASGPTRNMEISFPDERVQVLRIFPLTEKRVPVWSAPWDTPHITVSSPGLPTVGVDVSYFEKELAVPDGHWQRPVILVLPSVEDLSDVVEKRMSLQVTVSGTTNKTQTIPNYAGWALWLGTDQSLEVPRSLQNQLETLERNVILAMAGDTATERLKLASTVFNWSRPALSEIAILSPADLVTVSLMSRGNNCVMGETEIRVDSVARYPLVKEIVYDGRCRD